MLRRLLILLAIVAFACSTVGPIAYLYYAARLPRLESEFDLEKLLRSDIEAERMSTRLSKYARESMMPIKFERPDITRLPKDLVALYISQRGCPTFFQTPREEGLRWATRLIVGLFGSEPPGDGWCERLFAWRLARRIGAEGIMRETVGANKIHSMLQKDQLVAYDLLSIRFESGIVGVDALALKLFRKQVLQLELSELAEMILALPPHNYYRQIRDCQNPTLIRQNRDYIIARLARAGLVAPDRAELSRREPVACTR